MEHHGTPWTSPDKSEHPVTSPASYPGLTSSPQPMTPAASPTLLPSELPLLSPPRPAPMERRASCDLFECIEQHSRFDVETAKYVFRQVVEVVAALGSLGICHRDIKDENIVISSDLRVSHALEHPLRAAPTLTCRLGAPRSSSSTLARRSSTTLASQHLSTRDLSARNPSPRPRSYAARRIKAPRPRFGRSASSFPSSSRANAPLPMRKRRGTAS